MRLDWDFTWMFAGLGFFAGLIGGGGVSFFIAEDVQHDFDERAELRAECVRGNENACCVYAIDRGNVL